MELEVIKKIKGIGGLVSGYTPKKVEEIRKIEPNKDSLLRRYLEFLLADDLKENLRDVDEIVLPHEINNLLGFVGVYDNWEDRAGHFISKLIQNSYYAGNRTFHLDNPFSNLNYLCSNLHGDMTIIINGYGGKGIGTYSSACRFILDCETKIIGYKPFCSQFIINGLLRNVDQSTNCTYKTGREDVLAVLLEKVCSRELIDTPGDSNGAYHVPSENKIIFIENGEEKVIREHNKTKDCYSGPVAM